MRPPLVIAHRGASAAHPPGNTVEAFRAARALGADWVELDVRRLADGALAVHHDAHLPDGRALHELRAADLPAWVPLLDAALEACAGLGVNVEIKNHPSDPGWDDTAAVVDAVVPVLSAEEPTRWLVTSFDLATVDRVRELAPDLPTGFLVFDVADPAAAVAAAAGHGHRALNPWDPFVDAELVERCGEAGLELYPWTVDDPVRMAELVDLGVAGIITNHPEVLRSVVDGS